MGRYQPQTLGPLRGLNEDEDPHALQPGDLVVADNIARFGTMVGTRPGTVTPTSGEDYEDAIDGDGTATGTAIQGMYEWRSDQDDNRELLCISDATGGVHGACGVYYEDAGVYADGATITVGADNIWHMTEHNDVLWGAGGAATDSFWYLTAGPANHANAPTAVALPCSAGVAYPQYVISWRNYLLANGFRGNTVADCNPATTRFCTLGSDPTVAASWAPGNTVGFNAFGDSFTTGFGTYRDNAGDYLLILMNDKIQAVVLNPNNAFQITDAVANGCVSQRAFVSLGLDSGEAVYLSEKGIHSLRQSQQHGTKADTFLSWKLRPTWATLNRSRLKYAVGAYDHVNGWVLFAVPTGSNTYNDTILCLDVKNQESLTAQGALWYKWKMTGGIRIQDMKFLRDGTTSENWKLMIATHLGNILYLSTDTYTDAQVDGTSTATYVAELQTAHNDYGTTLYDKRLGDTMVTLHPGGDYLPSFKVVFDYGARSSKSHALNMQTLPGDTWGAFAWGAGYWSEAAHTRDEKVHARGRGRTIGFNIQHQGSDQPWRVSKIDHQIALVGEDTGSTANA